MEQNAKKKRCIRPNRGSFYPGVARQVLSSFPLGLEGELMKVPAGGEEGSLGEPCPWRRALWKSLVLG